MEPRTGGIICAIRRCEFVKSIGAHAWLCQAKEVAQAASRDLERCEADFAKHRAKPWRGGGHKKLPGTALV